MAKRKTAAHNATVSFEAALQTLETVVDRLEKGEMPLEEAIRLFEEGIGLARYCAQKLEEAEKRIDALVEDADGTLSFRPFAVEEESV